MTVLDTTVVIDYLLGSDAGRAVERLMASEVLLSAPDLITFEILAVLRRQVRRGLLNPDQAQRLVDLYGEMSIELFPTYPMRQGAWELRDGLTVGDAFFITLADELGEPLATSDQGLANFATEYGVAVVDLT